MKNNRPWLPTFDVQQAKTIKTANAVAQAFDDLHLIRPKCEEHAEAKAVCGRLLQAAEVWT